MLKFLRLEIRDKNIQNYEVLGSVSFLSDVVVRILVSIDRI